MPNIPTGDLERSKIDGERVGCLISEVVTPGFDWHDHEYMTVDGERQRSSLGDRV